MRRAVSKGQAAWSTPGLQKRALVPESCTASSQLTLSGFTLFSNVELEIQHLHFFYYDDHHSFFTFDLSSNLP